jgi:hypothetical protein
VKRALLVLLLCDAVSAAGRDIRPEERVFLEIETARESYYVGEPFRLVLRVGVDRRYFQAHSIPLFNRQMDLQLQVEWPFFERLSRPGAPGLGRDPLSFALNDRVVGALPTADRMVDGRPYTVLEIERTYLPSEPGDLTIEAPTLRFAYGTEFEEDLLMGRRPLTRHDAVVEGEPTRLEIRALPAAGRPRGFTGAVGRFTVAAQAGPRDLAAGESLKLTLRVEGEGNLSRFDPPRLDGLPGFHVYGLIDDRGAKVRNVVYDLTPIDAAVTAIPAIGLPYFDPLPPARYRVARTLPIPLTVRPGPGSASAPEPEEVVSPRPSRTLPLVVAALALASIGAAALLARRRARERGRVAPEVAHVLEAEAAFRARSGADPTSAFAEFLGVFLDCPPAAVIAPELRARLAGAGVPDELGERTAALLEKMIAARYGGDTSEDAAASEVVEALVGLVSAASRRSTPP